MKLFEKIIRIIDECETKNGVSKEKMRLSLHPITLHFLLAEVEALSLVKTGYLKGLRLFGVEILSDPTCVPGMVNVNVIGEGYQ